MLTHPHQLQDRDKTDFYNTKIADWKAKKIPLQDMFGIVPNSVIARAHLGPGAPDLGPEGNMDRLQAVESLIESLVAQQVRHSHTLCIVTLRIQSNNSLAIH